MNFVETKLEQSGSNQLHVVTIQARRKRCGMAAVAAPKICREREREGRERRKEREKRRKKREEKKEREGRGEYERKMY